MKVKYTKELKFSTDLEEGDTFKIGGIMCEVVKVDEVFHHTPNSRVRIVLKAIGATPKKSEVILFLPHGTPITVLS